MGKIDYFSILLHKPTPIYFSGETIAGSVNIKVRERLKINCVKMLITGYARVHWTESHGSGKNRTTRHYSAQEDYLNFNVIFLAKQANNDLYLEVGEFSYPFQVVLPPNLPTSFEHTIGRVRYSINGTIDIPWAFDKHSTRSFSVINNVDLNLYPQLRQSYGASASKVLCCGICKSDPIVATFNIMKGGYVPGEGIVFNATIDNRSNREVKRATVSLIQNMRFHATSKSRTVSRTVASIKYPKKIEARSVETWNNSVLAIPPVCSSTNGTCRIIEVNYLVVFNFDAAGLSISTDLTIPITIGTIPLRIENVPSAPLPSYEASIFGPNTDEAQMPEPEIKGEVVESDANTFRPIYPYYRDYSLESQNKFQ